MLQANSKALSSPRVDLSEVYSRYLGNIEGSSMTFQGRFFDKLNVSSLSILEGSPKQGLSDFLPLSFLSFPFQLQKKNGRFLFLERIPGTQKKEF
jgi:hypothetical protein